MTATTQQTGIAFFETAIGTCGIAWGDRGITATALPHSRPERTRAALGRRAGGDELAPPPEVADAIDRIKALLDGDAIDLGDVDLDMSVVSDFDCRIAEVARTIQPGETLTYGEIAARAGAPGEAREVGAAMGRNRFPIIVPCHRVVAADGKLGGFSAPGGSDTKRRMLAIEGHHIRAPLSLFDAA